MNVTMNDAFTSMLPTGQAAPQGDASTEGRLRSWLAAAGLLRSREIIKVSAMSERTTAVLVELDDGTSLFVKRPRPQRSEHVLIALSSGRRELNLLSEFLPTVVHHDDASNVTVMLGLASSHTLRETWLAEPHGARALLCHVALGIAQLHTSANAAAIAAKVGRDWSVAVPVPTYGGLSPSDLAQASGLGFPTYLARVQEINHALRALRASWRPECLIHGDFKDDNIMVESPAGDPVVRFVDWELAGRGDPLWDVGSLVGQFLYHWVASISQGATRDFAAWVRDASIPFSDARCAAQCFVSSYMSARQPGWRRPERIDTIVRFAGLFLVHRTLATLEVTGTLTGAAANCLQVGQTLIGSPERARPLILGDLS